MIDNGYDVMKIELEMERLHEKLELIRYYQYGEEEEPNNETRKR